jgi:two-component SAPR family response regulator
MGRLLLLVCSLLIAHSAFCQSHGLRFSSHEVVPEKRTSLNLTPKDPLCFKQPAEISFDCSFTPNLETYFGYILRLVTSNNQNIDIVYNQKLQKFNFVIGETVSGEFTIDSLHLYNAWNQFKLTLDGQTQETRFYLNNRLIATGKANISHATCYRIFFGANDLSGFQITDIPPMNIKDIRIAEAGAPVAYYPLSESNGTECADEIKSRVASVKNPVWIKPRHQNWVPALTMDTRGVASIAFDKNTERLYIVSTDSLYQYSFRHGQLTGLRLTTGRDTLAPGNQSVFNAAGNVLYNFNIDEKAVSTWLPQAGKWDQNIKAGPLTVYWQANKFLSPVDSSLYVIGGYGQLQYRNEVQRYHFPTREWESVDPGGDFFMPRYLAALGANAAGDTAYIMGGFGSKTGDQTINPKYTYELVAWSVRSRSFKSIYHLKEPAQQFCFANSLVIDPATRDFYALIHPIDRFNSVLQLMKGSLQTPEYQLMGDTIPYDFHDIESFADLYYCPASKKLVAVTLFTNKQNVTRVKVYTIDFPPNKIALAPVIVVSASRDWIWFLAAGGLVAAGVLLMMWRKKQARQLAQQEVPAQPVVAGKGTVPAVVEQVIADEATTAGNKDRAAIYLFGQLEVFDKAGNDITKMFTPLLKELFLLVLVYTYKDGKGIASEKLYETLWGDKPIKDARNNFSVNVVKLKGILEKVGECHIGKESGKWKLDIPQDTIRIDYQHYMELVANKGPINKAYVSDLMQVVGRGAFLSTMHYSWLDDIKSEVSGKTIDILLHYISTADPATEAEFIIKATNCIFFFDQLNEDALAWKCKCLVLLGRHGMAKDAYLKFAKEYRENYGQDFERSFTEVTGQ